MEKKIKKRTYLESIGNDKYLKEILKNEMIKLSKLTSKMNLTYKPLKEETSNYNHIKSFDQNILTFNNDFPIYLFAKIFCKYNLCYEKYLMHHKIVPAKKEKNNNSNKVSVNSKNNNIDNNNNNINNINNINNFINNNSDNTNKNNNPHNINNEKNSYSGNKFVNSEFYPIVKNHKDINPKNIVIKDVIGDGNCLMRAFSQFLYGTEYMYNTIRGRIYNEAIIRKNTIPNVIIETELGQMRIHDYINNIKDDGFQGGDFELSIGYELFNINIAEYKEYAKNIIIIN